MTPEVFAADGRTYAEVAAEIRTKFRDKILVARRGRTLVIQSPTWLVNNFLPLEDFVDEYLENPFTFAMEYGAEFAEAVDAWMPADIVDRCFKAFSPIAPKRAVRVVAMDPGLKSSRYGLTMGYRHKGETYLELAMAWQGSKERPVDIESVEDFVLDTLKPAYRIGVVVLDQHQSASTIQLFNKAGLKTRETFFTASRNIMIYTELRKQMVAGKFWYSNEELREELKHIQQIASKSGNVKIMAAPGYHDDLADCAANMAYELTKIKKGTVII